MNREDETRGMTCEQQEAFYRDRERAREEDLLRRATRGSASALDALQTIEDARATVRELAPRALARLTRRADVRAELEALVEVLDEGAPHLGMRLAAIVATMDTQASEDMQRQIVAVTAERDEANRELERTRRELVDVTERFRGVLAQLEALR